MILKYRKYIIYFILHLFLHGEVFDGYTLFTPKSAQEDGASTRLMNNDYDIMHSWSHEQGPASMPYLLPDSSIIYPYRVPNPTMDAGGVGGGIEKQSWDGEILWNYTFSNEYYQHHHDVEPLPNGNILVIVWEKKTMSEAYAMGRVDVEQWISNEMWSTAMLRPFQVEDLAKTGDSEIKQLLVEYTLVSKNEASSGKIADCTTS